MNFNSKLTKSLMLVLLILLPLSFLAVGSIGSLALASPSPGWELRATLPRVLFTSISAVDESTAWATEGGVVGTDVSGIFKTTDGGTTWTPQTTNWGYNSISAVNASTAYAVGSTKVSKTIDGGANWNTIYSDPTLNALKVHAIDANNVVVAGAFHGDGEVYGRAFVARSSDGGVNWTLLYLASVQSAILSLSAPSMDVIWVAGQVYNQPESSAALILKTADGGANWNQVSPAPNGEAFTPVVSAINANTAWTSSVVLSNTLAGHILKTTDGGLTWVPQYSYNGYGSSGISSINADVTWVTLSTINPFSGAIIKTSNGGVSWTTQKVTPGYALMPVSALNSSIAWVAGGVVTGTGPLTGPLAFSATCIVLRTTDGGGSLAAPTVTSVAPTEAGQYAFFVNLTVAGTGFQPGATLRLEKGGSVINASSVSVGSDTQLTASLFLFGVDPGTYDVVVTNPDSGEGKLAGGFNITSACGTGSGSAMLMLGLALGLLSLAGSARKRRRRKH